MHPTRALRGVLTRHAFSNNSPPHLHTSSFWPRAKVRMELSTSAAVAPSGSSNHHHDTHALPPNFIQREHWKYQTMRKSELEQIPQVFDLRRYSEFTKEQSLRWTCAGVIPASQIEAACEAYNGGQPLRDEAKEARIFEHRDFPGLRVIPELLPPETQVLFTSCLMHRDLSNPKHKINLQTDYDISYPSNTNETSTEKHRFHRTFFTRERAATKDCLQPRTPKHSPINMEQFLYSKLRWLTLGEQYDWPTRSYAKHATPFPEDLSKLVTGLFPHIRPESGVVLTYSAKDFMPVHRDVSEQCQRALASFSVGCDGIFILARGEDDGVGEDAPRTVVLRVRSGDCVHLDGEARWAWHAMARTIPGTCPSYLAQWPVGTPGATTEEEKAFKKWKGYMATKRINVSCRQVWD